MKEIPDHHMEESRVVYPTVGHCRSGVKEFVTRLPGAQAIGDYFSKNISGALEKSQSTKVLSISYEKVLGGDNLLLLLGYDGGYDIWDFKNGLHTHSIELIATKKTDFPVRGIRIFGKWTKDNNKWKGRFAINTVDEDKSIIVRCFSIGETTRSAEIGVLRFPSKVFSISGNENLLIVGMSNRIFGFSASTLSEVFSLSCFPNHPRNDSVMSLGSRWLAYPSDRTNYGASTYEGTQGDDGADMVMGAAQAAMSGLFWLGRKSTKAAGEYIQQRQQNQMNGRVDHSVTVHQSMSDDHGAAAALETYEATVRSMSDKAGIVAVLDVVEGQVISQMKAHPNEPLTCLAWSPCGSTLATASSSGQTLHIYGINKPCDLEARSRQHRSTTENAPKSSRLVPPPSFVLRYKLVRGLTPSSIRHLTISSDNLWCVATTSRRTSHIFAINPQGGLIDGEKHTPPLEQSAQFLVAQAEKAASVLSLEETRVKDDDEEFDFVNDSQFEETPTVAVRAVAKIYSVGAPGASERTSESGLPPRHPINNAAALQAAPPVPSNNGGAPLQQDWVGRDPFSCYVVGRYVLLATADAKSSRYKLQTSIETKPVSGTSSAASSPPRPSPSPSTASPLASLQIRLNAAIGNGGGPDKRLGVHVLDPDVWDVTPLHLSTPLPSQPLEDESKTNNVPPRPSVDKSATGSASNSKQHTWLRQIERKTRPTPRAPIWMSPHVSFSTSVAQGDRNPIRFEEKQVVRIVNRREVSTVPAQIAQAIPDNDDLQFDLSDE